MPKLPRLTARQIIAVLEKSGFSLVEAEQQSHDLQECSGKRVTVPYHASKILHPKVLKNILRDAELSSQDLERLS